MENNIQKIGQDQIHELLFQDKLSWQSIIYDLINTEQLDPWDIDISILAEKYLEKIKQLEEANFFVSSKVLLAASLLLRIKSEILLNRDIPSLDDILFGKKEEKIYVQKRIEFNEDVPLLVPKTPLPRFKRVSLDELMAALGKAIQTETRRIRKEIVLRQQEKEIFVVANRKTFNLKNKIDDIYKRISDIFTKKNEKLAFSDLISGSTKEDKIASFVSILHLDNQHKVWLEQDEYLGEIWIWLKSHYEKINFKKLSLLRAEVEEFMSKAEKEQEKSDLSMTGE